MKRIIIGGITGKTGNAVAQEVYKEKDCEIVAAIGKKSVGRDIGEILGLEKMERFVYPDIQTALEKCKTADVYIDFTNVETTEQNAEYAILKGLDVIIGTTGLSNQFVEGLSDLIQSEDRFGIISSNFSLGTAVLTRFSKILGNFFGAEKIEITEIHHDSKIDKPSGTALYLQELITSSGEHINISSKRVPYHISQHEVGVHLNSESLTVCHSVTDPKTFGEGVVFVLNNYSQLYGVYRDLATFIKALEETENNI